MYVSAKHIGGNIRGSLCSVCCLEHWSLTWQIKINIWKTLGIFTIPLCALLPLRMVVVENSLCKMAI